MKYLLERFKSRFELAGKTQTSRQIIDRDYEI